MATAAVDVSARVFISQSETCFLRSRSSAGGLILRPGLTPTGKWWSPILIQARDIARVSWCVRGRSSVRSAPGVRGGGRRLCRNLRLRRERFWKSTTVHPAYGSGVRTVPSSVDKPVDMRGGISISGVSMVAPVPPCYCLLFQSQRFHRHRSFL